MHAISAHVHTKMESFWLNDAVLVQRGGFPVVKNMYDWPCLQFFITKITPSTICKFRKLQHHKVRILYSQRGIATARNVQTPYKYFNTYPNQSPSKGSITLHFPRRNYCLSSQCSNYVKKIKITIPPYDSIATWTSMLADPTNHHYLLACSCWPSNSTTVWEREKEGQERLGAEEKIPARIKVVQKKSLPLLVIKRPCPPFSVFLLGCRSRGRN